MSRNVKIAIVFCLFAVCLGGATALSCTAAQQRNAATALTAVERGCEVFRLLAPMVPLVTGEADPPHLAELVKACGQAQRTIQAVRPIVDPGQCAVIPPGALLVVPIADASAPPAGDSGK